MLKCQKVDKTTAEAAAALAARLNKELTDPDDVDVDAAEHPEGRKRGGTVSLYSEAGARVFYDETAEEWVGYDDCEDDD